MSVINAVPLLAAAGGDYTISRSVRLRSSATAYFSRTFGAATSTTQGTFSFWLKRGNLSASFSYLWSASNYDLAYFDGSGTLWVAYLSNLGYVSTNAVFRDPSAWYHIVLTFDTPNATAADRLRVYVNGVRQTLNWGTTPQTQNATWQRWNVSGYTGDIGDFQFSHVNAFDGYYAEWYFIDGQALNASSFGENDAVTGVWKPKKYAGTYGTNGFYLNFSDNSAATAAAIGKDYSGNGNNWTPNNISVTSGVTYDSMIDVPTVSGAGSNYCVLNPLQPASTTVVVPTDGNLKMTGTASGNNVTGTMAIQASTYFEGTVITGGGTLQFGVRNLNTNNTYVYDSSGNKVLAGTSTAYGASFTTNDVIGIAVDPVNLTLQFFKNGTSQGTITSAFPSGDYVPFFYASNTNSSAANFGQRPYTPPSGFKALNTQNLPDSTIKKGNQYFDATTYTGNGSTQSIVNSGGMQPDLVWVKNRTSAYNHILADSVRGTGVYLSSSTTDADQSASTAVTAFNSNGFSIGSIAGGNLNGNAIVGWQWKKGATPGFDIVTYTGDSTTNRQISHSLGVKPAMMIIKNRDFTWDWIVYHKSITATGFLYLNQTTATTTSINPFNNTEPTSSVFTVAGNSANTYVNFSGAKYVAYLFSEVAGFSRMGSYQGNGSSDGSFVYLGFRPRWIMIKRTDTAEGWYIHDTSRSTYNVSAARLLPNSSAAEVSDQAIDFLSNGFKLRTSDGAINASGGTFVYAAFAENPFRNALAR